MVRNGRSRGPPPVGSCTGSSSPSGRRRWDVIRCQGTPCQYYPSGRRWVVLGLAKKYIHLSHCWRRKSSTESEEEVLHKNLNRDLFLLGVRTAGSRRILGGSWRILAWYSVGVLGEFLEILGGTDRQTVGPRCVCCWGTNLSARCDDVRIGGKTLQCILKLGVQIACQIGARFQPDWYHILGVFVAAFAGGGSPSQIARRKSFA